MLKLQEYLRCEVILNERLGIWGIFSNNSNSLFIYRGNSKVHYAWIYFNKPPEYSFYVKGDIPNLSGWSDLPGKLVTVLNEIVGWVPYILSIILFIIGAFIIIYDLWQLRQRKSS